MNFGCVKKVDEKQRSGTDTIEFHILPQTPNGKGIDTQLRWHEIKTARVESQGDSSFPDDHQAILNKMNTKSRTNKKQTNIYN